MLRGQDGTMLRDVTCSTDKSIVTPLKCCNACAFTRLGSDCVYAGCIQMKKCANSMNVTCLVCQFDDAQVYMRARSCTFHL